MDFKEGAVSGGNGGGAGATPPRAPTDPPCGGVDRADEGLLAEALDAGDGAKTDGVDPMAETETTGRTGGGAKAPPAAARFLALAGGWWRGGDAKAAWFLTACMLALTVGQVVVPVLINLWSQNAFDALERRSMDDFLRITFLIGGVIAFNAANTVLHMKVKRRIQYSWRRHLTEKLLDSWVRAGRPKSLNGLVEAGDLDNPDGRVAEDVRISTEAAIDLVLSFTFCGLLLASFVHILWDLSWEVSIPVGGESVPVPGHLVWIALAYAGAGTVAAMLIGRPLAAAANKRQSREAGFRFGLARLRENAEEIDRTRSEPERRAELSGLLLRLKGGWDDQTNALSRMMFFSAAYSTLSVAFPIVIAAPGYVSGAITLGALMRTTQAFQQTIGALAWPIDNLPRAAEWKASALRVLGLWEALEAMPEAPAGGTAHEDAHAHGRAHARRRRGARRAAWVHEAVDVESGEA